MAWEPEGRWGGGEEPSPESWGRSRKDLCAQQREGREMKPSGSETSCLTPAPSLASAGTAHLHSSSHPQGDWKGPQPHPQRPLHP